MPVRISLTKKTSEKIESLEKDLRNGSPALMRFLSQFGEKVSDEARSIIKEKGLIKTGLLLDSNSSYVLAHKNSVYASNRAPYAHFIEYGTSKMRPKPFLSPALERHRDKFSSELLEVLENEAH